jgi:hypothetical protein
VRGKQLQINVSLATAISSISLVTARSRTQFNYS